MNVPAVACAAALPPMVKRILSPLMLCVVALLLSTAGGSVWFYRSAVRIAQSAKATRVKVETQAAEKARSWETWTVRVDGLVEDLAAEKARLADQGKVLDLRATRLAAERQELDRLRLTLENFRKSISTQLVETQAAEVKNLRMLAQTYSTLTPHGAVSIIRELDDVTAVKILALMKPDVIAPIFDDMVASAASAADARRAAALSEKLRLLTAAKSASTP
jgi:flagellar motility protein MotE (MotC chaperone)